MAKMIRAARNFQQWSWLIKGVAAALWAVWLSPLTVSAADLTIQLVGLHSTSRQLRLSLYDQDERFLKGPVPLACG